MKGKKTETLLINGIKIKGISQVNQACGDFITMYCEECGEKYYVHLGCGKRTCPHCAEKRARELYARTMEVVKKWQYKSHIVLTMRRSQRVGEGVREIKQAFNRLKRVRIKIKDLGENEQREIEAELRRRGLGERKSVGWKDLVKNAIGVVETKPKEDGWHIHIHALVNSEWIPQWLLAKLWAKATRGRGRIVYIKRVWGDKSAVWEVVKYVMKISQMREERREEFERELKNVPLVVRWRVSASSLEGNTEIVEQDLRCDLCGGRLIRVPELSRRVGREEILEMVLSRERIEVAGDEPF